MSNQIKIDINADTRSLADVQKELKAIKGEMIGLEGDAFTDAAMRAATLQTEVKRANDAVRELSGSGDDLARMGSTMGGIGKSLASLDFTAANEGAARMLAISQGMNFKSAIGSLKQLGGTFMTLGKSLLTNPFFLMVGVIVAIGVAIYKLMDEIGLLTVIMDGIGKVMDFLMIPINALINGLKALTDWFGWTNNAGKDLAEEQIARNNELSASVEKTSNDAVGALQHEINMRKAAGEDTTDLEREKIILLQTTAAEQLRIAEDTAKQMITLHGKDSDEYKEQIAAIEGLKQAKLDSGRELEVFEAQQAAKAKAKRDKETADELKRIEKENADKAAKGQQAADARKAAQEKADAEAETLRLKTIDAQRKADLMIEEEKLRQTEDEIERTRLLAEFKEQQNWENLDKTLLNDLQVEELRKQHLERLNQIQLDADETVRLRDEAKAAEIEAKKIAENKKLAEIDAKRTKDELDEKKKREEAEKILNDMIVGGAMDSVNAIAGAAKEGSAIQKVAALASIGANLAQSIMAANAAAAAAAAAAGPGAPAAYAATLASILPGVIGAGVQAYKVLKSTPNVGGGSTGGGSTPSISSVTPSSTETPQFNLFGQANETGGDSTQFGGTERGNDKPQTIRAVVSWSDIDAVGTNDSNLKNEMQL